MPPTIRPIAIIGVACRYPGAEDARSLWENVLGRRRQFRTIPDCRLPLSEYHDPNPDTEDLTYGRRGAFMDGWSFDPATHRVPRSTFESTDIVHWLTLDIARQAVRHAGLDLERMNRDRIGMVLGNTLTGEETRANSMRLRWPFLRRALRHAATGVGLGEEDERRLEGALLDTWRSVFPKITEDSLAGGLSNTIAGRVCNALDLHGGGYVVDGACASSLLAIATAGEMLESGQLDVALAGGVDMSLDPFELVGFAKATALTTGDMQVYDRRGAGFIPGEGCGVVILQPLEDARRDGRRVLAVLRGWGISSDGRGGITAPSARGQSLAVRRAYERAGYSPHTLTFIEGHGTGTAVGDRVELEGIAQALEAWGPPEPHSIGITSFKSIAGHTKAAAGIGGFIKAVLAVNQRTVPPTAGCTQPHQAFAEAARALYPVLKTRVVNSGDPGDTEQPLRAGVSAMGFGGINTHVTLESGDAPLAEFRVDDSLNAAPHSCELFPLAAASLEELREQVTELRGAAEGIAAAELADLAVHVARRSSRGPWRGCVVAASVDELCASLDHLAAGLGESDAGSAHQPQPPRAGFLFPGQGSQLVGMAAGLVDRYAWAAQRVAEADAALADLEPFTSAPLSTFIFRPTWMDPAGAMRRSWREALTDTRVAQPAIALASALWCEHLERLGIRPAVVAGHSLGELTALYASGAYDFRSLLRIAARRGQAMAAPPETPGAMAAVECSAQLARELLAGTDAVVANRNAPDQTVVSGSADAIDEIMARARKREVAATRLRVSNAFHSPLVASAGRALAEDPEIPTRAARRFALPLSCTDGAPINADADLREHLARQITAPVDFVALADALRECDVLLEVGPGGVLTELVRRCGSPTLCLPVETLPGEDREACTALRQLFVLGADVQWSALHAGRFVRPFVPASERTFYRNPCERPFPPIRLEMTRPAAPSPPVTRDIVHSEVALTKPEVPSAAAAPAESRSLRSVLYELIAEKTGFSQESLHDGLRLLDDLNLDSIKAGALLATIGQRAGLAAPPEGLANSTLSEVLDALSDRSGLTGTETQEPAWVASFVSTWTTAPLSRETTGASPFVVIGRGALGTQLAAAVPGTVVMDDDLDGLAESLGDLVVLMPDGPADLTADVRRMASLSTWRARFPDRNLPRLTLVQRGDGRFGQLDADPDHLGLRGFAASLMLEQPALRIRVLDIHRAIDLRAASRAVIDELGVGSSGIAGYAADGTRLVPQLARIDEADALKPAPDLPAGSVALVTGGGKGITAECALTLGRATGCRLVLVGSSAPGAEVQRTLERMQEAGLQAEYRRCDLTDEKAVRTLVQHVRDEVGPIDIVLHGAGVNRPRNTLSVGFEDAWTEIGPKLRGCENLLAALGEAPPRLCIALTSVIGVLGMRGNAWYAFSNERVDLELRRLARRSPGTRVVSFAYSIWDEVGMGVTLGRVDALARQGIGAIPVDQGVLLFRRWLLNRPPDSQVIVTSRMGALLRPAAPSPGRFRGDVITHAPSVEHMVRVHLHPNDDRYLADHDFRGSLLFPTVMGLEAMAQTSCACLGLVELPAMRIEDICLDRPIVVDPSRGEQIEIRTRVRERQISSEPRTVDASIYTATTGFAVVHFRARFVLEPSDLHEPCPRSETALEIDPASDLYGGLLFQGPLFQRLRRVLHLDEHEILFETEARAKTLSHPEGFSAAHRLPLVAGDPYHRDTLLQAAQLIVTPEIALPVRIDRIDLVPPSLRAEGPALARAKFLGRDGDSMFVQVSAWDAGGRLVERITGYVLRVLDRDDQLPDVRALLQPAERDLHVVELRLAEAAARWQLRAPYVELAHKRGLHSRSRDERRATTEPLLMTVARRAANEGTLGWEASGRPVLIGTHKVGLSLAHDDATVLAIAGEGPQGCDIVGPARHTRGQWIAMLSSSAHLLDAMQPEHDLDLAGRVLWAAREAAAKALQDTAVELRLLDSARRSAWHFAAQSPRSRTDILVIVARLARGGDRVIAVTAQAAIDDRLLPVVTTGRATLPADGARDVGAASVAALRHGYGNLGSHGATLSADGPDGQPCVSQRSMVTFREASDPSGSMRHSHFVNQMGALRELAAKPVLQRCVDDFMSGNWGAVTNRTRLVVVDRVAAGETVEARVWCAGLSGPLRSTMDLGFSWRAIDEGGASRPVARGSMSTTWVALIGHGEARVAANPAYLDEFAARIAPGHGGPQSDLDPPDWSERGELVYQASRHPGGAAAYRRTFGTTREHSNVVGNIYFAHYVSWQGEAVDAMLASLDPEYARTRSSELRVNSVSMDHFREAMPYDLVEVHVQVECVWQRGLALRAEVYRRTGSELVKLAAGQLEGTWYAADGQGIWKPAALPGGIVGALRGDQFPLVPRATEVH